MRIPETMLTAAARLGLIFLITVLASASARWLPVAEAVEWRGASQGEQDVQALEPNIPIERELAGGQVHAYRITLAAGQYLRVVVDQRGIDVVVTLFGPDGKKLAEIDSPNGARGPEQVSIVAKVAGNHRLEVRSLDKSAAAGRYEAKITALRDATLEDKTEYLATRLAEAKTEAERTELLAAEKELVTEKLAQALNKLGDGLRRQGKYAQALTHFRFSQNIAEQIGDKAGIASTLRSIGVIYDLQGNYAQALELYRKSLTLREALGDKAGIASVLGDIGEMYRLQGNYTQTLEFAQRAVTVARSVGAKETLWRSLTNAGRAYQHLNQPGEARQALEEAITLVEALRSQVSGQESRASYFASKQEVYESYIDLLMQTRRLRPDEGNEAIAFQSSERARARSLLELLTEARADIRQGIDPSLLERERSLHHQLNARAERQTRLHSGNHTEEQVTAIKKEIDTLTDEFRQVQAQIRQTSPRYAALTQPAPLSLKEIQQQVLDDDSLLLEYSLGEERSYLWAVTSASITGYELPKRAEIEAAAKRAYDLLLVSNQRRAKRQAELAAAGLSRLLLGPVAGKLGSKRLLIVSDGALQYVPFGALPTPQSGRQNKNPRSAIRNPQSPSPLIADHEVVHLPSASTLAVLRREQAGRQPASKTVAALADPVLSPDDPRVKSAMARASQTADKAAPVSDMTRGATDNLVRSATETGVMNWERLPFTRAEADAIARLGPGENSFKALDFEASRTTATNPDLSQYRVVHFATHGLLNSQHPELSGIVLSLVDERGQSQDGFLRLHDIYNLKLDADLVALSACQTALGKDVKGEGLIGLTRGFMYAGAPRVIASLWSVKDEATAELMKRFYGRMLKDGLRPAAALREAQLSMWKEKRWEAPYYWAGFVLQGEWR